MSGDQDFPVISSNKQAGYKRLGDSDVKFLLNQQELVSSSIQRTDSTELKAKNSEKRIPTGRGTTIEYRIVQNKEDQKQRILITTPLDATTFRTNIRMILDAVQAINQDKKATLVVPLVRRAAMGDHMIVAYANLEGDINNTTRLISYYDSKKSSLRSFTPKHGGVIECNESYHSLDTQRLPDDVTCGYRAVQLIYDSLNNSNSQSTNEPLSLDSIIQKLKANPETKDKCQDTIGDHLERAWLNTYRPLEERPGSHYFSDFMEWPQKTAEQVIYVLTLGFVTAPILNLIKLPELFLQCLIGVLNAVEDAVKITSQTWTIAKYTTSLFLLGMLGLKGLLMGLYFAVGLVTSPITSLKRAYKVHPILGILSLVISLAIFGVLLYLLAPVAAAGLAALAPAAFLALQPIVMAIAYPLLQLAALIPLAVAPISAALTLLVTGVAAIITCREVGYGMSAAYDSAQKNKLDENDFILTL